MCGNRDTEEMVVCSSQFSCISKIAWADMVLKKNDAPAPSHQTDGDI